ncbi:N-methyl-L-tryptophan oxidase [Curtobacterium sp. 9128]|uniref:N-methyl-L-tryptophan oxidase n=1 Tax=Curtobacterium sp. 9128 TaxID=1793722 RepID=UPI00119E8990|nr:N-methyl-L-tryptophan oxidase [Curtobacterium sp. 9128]
MTRFDAEVGVVGVGTMGAQTMWQLARRGVSAIGFEQFAPGHDRSGAGGESRLFRTAYLEGSHYVPLLRRSRAAWEQLGADTGVEVLRMTGGLMIGSDGSSFLESVARSITEHGIDHEFLDTDALGTRYPQHAVRPGDVAYLDHESGWLRPEVAVTLAASEAERLGGVVHRRARVTEIRMTDAAVEVHTEERVFRFPRLVVAAGVWTARLLPGITPLHEVIRIVMTWFPTVTPERFTEDVFPIFVRQSDGFDISGWPSIDGATVKIGLNNGWDRVADPDRLDRSVPDELFAEVREAVRALVPGVVPEVVRAGVYMDGYTADHDAFVGPLGWDDRVTVLGGFSGHGFKLAPAMGTVAADLATTGTTDLPVGFLDPARFSATVTAADRLRFGRPGTR